MESTMARVAALMMAIVLTGAVTLKIATHDGPRTVRSIESWFALN